MLLPRRQSKLASSAKGKERAMSQMGLGCVKAPKLNLRIESLSRFL
jgi:hypothetical protein